MEMNPGALVVAAPFKYEYNPELNKPEKIGIFLGWKRDTSGWRGARARLLTAYGYEECWSSQWAVKLLR